LKTHAIEHAIVSGRDKAIPLLLNPNPNGVKLIELELVSFHLQDINDIDVVTTPAM